MMFGLVTKSRHEREMEKARETDKAALDEYATNLDDARNNLALYRDDRDDWRDKHNSLLTKFKKAITDLAAAREELNEAKLHIDHLGITFNQRVVDAVQDYADDAILWRNARDRRANKRTSGR